MILPSSHLPVVPVFSEEMGWRRMDAGAVTLWHCGYLHGRDWAGVLAAATDAQQAARVVRELDGHWALALIGPGWTVAAVDRVRSFPLAVAECCGRVFLGSHAPTTAAAAGLTGIDREQALVFGMAGFTMAGRTLVAGLGELETGEAITIEAGSVTRWRHHVYRPWLIQDAPEADLRRSAAEITLAVMEKMVKSVGGRTIVVPLSAGLDSRLIVAALAHLGVRDVRCFAYGLPGNFEAEASRRIAAHLGYEWTFVPHTPASQAATFASPACVAYRFHADSLAAVPFQQDLDAILRLKASGFIPADAVVVNGQSGDYITGNHIPASLSRGGSGDAEQRWRAIGDALIAKHYGMWASLRTPDNLALVHRLVREDLERAGAELGDPALDFALYELSEFRNRQAKYVVGGQRIYDFAGIDWRLPLWDDSFVDFWQGVPLAQKFGQRLYRDMLMAENWGGVWQGWNFPRTVSPVWMRPLRLAAKALHAPLGAKRWHRFERRVLAYWLDLVANYAVVPYGRVLTDRRGHRNAIAWHVEQYLAEKGLNLDGSPLAGKRPCG